MFEELKSMLTIFTQVPFSIINISSSKFWYLTPENLKETTKSLPWPVFVSKEKEGVTIILAKYIVDQCHKLLEEEVKDDKEFIKESVNAKT